MNLRVEELVTDTQFEAIREEWNDLLSQSANNEITLTWEWIHTWWGVFKDDTRRLMILAVRDENNCLVGIAPFQLRTVYPYWFLPAINQLSFLAFGEEEADEICTDYLNFIISRGCGVEVISKIWEYLTSDQADAWDEILLDAISRDSENVRHLCTVVESQSRYDYEEVVNGHCYFMKLPVSWDAFMESLDNGFRSKYRRDLKRAAAQGKLIYSLAKTPEALKEGFGLLTRLHQLRWTGKGREGVFSSRKFSLFHERFSDLALKNGYIELRSIHLNDVPLAVIYNFFYNNKIYFYQTGIDTLPYKNIAPGMLMHGHCIADAIDRNIREYDFLRGEAGYKAKWTRQFRDLKTIRISSRATKMRRIRMVKSAIGILRSVYRWCKSKMKMT